ncbi:MAG: porin [Pseudoruegeria sp.]
MKKVLIATTALVASAGFASAEVALSGDGRMGLIYDGDDAAFTSRARVTFTLTGETDNGLAFGGSFRADNASSASSGSAGSVFISGDFGKLSMGDVDSGAEAAVGDVSGVGLTGLGDYNESLFITSGVDTDGDGDNDLGSATPKALYEFTTGAFGLYVGLANPAGVLLTSTIFDSAAAPFLIEADNAWSLGASYSGDNWRVGAGYESMDMTALTASGTVAVGDSVTVDAVTIGGNVSFGDAVVKAVYGQSDDLGDYKQAAISIDYTFDATTLTAFYRKTESDLANLDNEFWGVGASYDLGGGASLVGGVASDDDDETADFGISFSF